MSALMPVLLVDETPIPMGNDDGEKIGLQLKVVR
jgi:hypothetical protein